ncbi:hypothetical protein ACSVDE_03300 [Pseudalkalibacillus sp. Hm43]|uniref:hypothetical protein n=1 Tax=Pseudalkalibacillus sp. Hm43 TaxID=3450742 RepID=UPI003F438BC9
MVLSVGCSDKMVESSTFFEIKKTEEIQVSVLDRPTVRTKEDAQIQSVIELINDKQLMKASTEEMKKIHMLRNKPEYESIDLMVETTEEVPSTTLLVLNDGRLVLTEIEDGLGRDFYQLKEPSIELYNELLALFEQDIEGKEANPHVLELLENDQDQEVEVEVDVIRSSEKTQ